MAWFLPAFAATLVWGVGQIFIKKGLTTISPFFNNLLAVIFALLLEVPFALSGTINFIFFPKVLFLGLLACSPSFIIPYVIQKTDVSLSGTILASYPIYTIILSVIFLSEKLKPLDIVGIIAILIGMLLVTRIKTKTRITSKWLSIALFGSIILGVGYFFSKVAITKYGFYTYILAAALSNIPCLITVSFLDRSKKYNNLNTKDIIISLIGNFLMPLGVLLMYIALNKGPASLVSPIISTYPAFTALLAYFCLKEKIGKINIFGIFAVILGVVILAA